MVDSEVQSCPRIGQKSPRTGGCALRALFVWVLVCFGTPGDCKQPVERPTSNFRGDASRTLQRNRNQTSATPSSEPSSTRIPSPSPSRVPTDSPIPSPSPTRTPTQSPTVASSAVPSSDPSTSPSAHPTASPSTSSPSSNEPSSLPTAMATPNPTIPQFVGTLTTRLSIYHESTVAAMIDESSVLLLGVLNALRQVLCRMTDMHLMASTQNDVCIVDDPGHNNVPYNDSFVDSMLWQTPGVIVQDGRGGNLTWTYWIMTYPVLQIGSLYTDTAIMNFGDDVDVTQAGLSIMRDVVDLALQVSIEEGEFDNHLQQFVPDAYASVLGQEMDTFSRIPDFTLDPTAIPTRLPFQLEEREGLDPSVMHPLRASGLLLLIFTVACSVCIVQLAGARRRRRDHDELLTAQGRGGLVTEEGLEHMLLAGRRESQKTLSRPQGQAPPRQEGDSRGGPFPLPSNYLHVKDLKELA